MTDEPVLKVDRLVKHFPIRRGFITSKTVGHVRAVDDVSFEVARGETLALVGESGCGKSTTGRLILRLIEPTSGSVTFQGSDIAKLPKRDLRRMRRHIQLIFQDPYASLNPRMTVGDILSEPLQLHGLAYGKEQAERVRELLQTVGLLPEHARRYPHQFSGGQRQRIGIARALAVSPDVIICDEPVSALDVSIQAQIVALIRDLQAETRMSLIFISHDLSVVRRLSHRVMVLYLGRVVEMAPSEALYADPRHPYTRALLSAVLTPDPRAERARKRELLTGDLPSPLDPKAQLSFLASKLDQPGYRPKLIEVAPGHFAAEHD